MESVFKCLFGAVGGALAYIAPVHTLIVLVFAFVAFDFVTGVWASRKRAKRRGENWVFSSERMRNTAYKTTFYILGVIGAWLMQAEVFDFVEMHLEKFFAGFVLGVEFFSFLENAADISDHPVFRRLRAFTAKELKDKTGIDIEEEPLDETVEPAPSSRPVETAKPASRYKPSGRSKISGFSKPSKTK